MSSREAKNVLKMHEGQGVTWSGSFAMTLLTSELSSCVS